MIIEVKPEFFRLQQPILNGFSVFSKKIPPEGRRFFLVPNFDNFPETQKKHWG